MPEFKLTIVFRGLIVFNKQGDKEDSYFEAGILYNMPDHYFRIHIVKNSVLETVQMISDADVQANRQWEIEVTNPLVKGVDTEWKDSFIRNEPSTFARDFRYLIDLEELHGELGDTIDTSILMPVIRVPYGKFYTRLRSRPLMLLKNGTIIDSQFGNISVAVGCDINVRIDEPRPYEPVTVAELKSDGETIFEFQINPNEHHTIYEIVNSPPDVFNAELGSHESHGSLVSDESNGSDESHILGTNHWSKGASKNIIDHFNHYYCMFGPHDDEYGFDEQEGIHRRKLLMFGPRPALCGAVLLGKREKDL